MSAFEKARIINPLHVVGDGDEARDYLSGRGKYSDRAAHPLPGFVPLDLKLLRRSGLDVRAWMRAKPCIKRIPVIVLTSSRESVDVDRTYELGVNSYLCKPVAFDALGE